MDLTDSIADLIGSTAGSIDSIVQNPKKLEIFKNDKMIIIIINFHNGSRKPRKFSRSRMMKRTVSLNSSREI